MFPPGTNNLNRFPLQSPRDTPSYLQGVRGFFASVRATTGSTLVNCNACCGAFYKSGPLEHLFAVFIPSNRSPSPEHFKWLEKAIQGLRVEFNHLKDDKGNQVGSLLTIFGLARPYGGLKDVELYHKEDEQAYTVATYWAKKGTSLPTSAFEVSDIL